MQNKGLLLIVCGPSGVGKGTVCKRLVEENPKIVLSISATTRKPRTGEVDGIHYYFKTEQDFKSMIDQNELLEWAVYCNNYYGTPKQYTNEMLLQGKDVILEIDVQGALNVKSHYPDGVLVFILPPSMQELRNRIVDRGTENEEVIKKRLDRAMHEISYIDQYNYVIVNDDLENAVQCLKSIIIAEKCKTERNKDVIKGVCKQ